MPPQAVQLGLDGLKRIELQWGIPGRRDPGRPRRGGPAPRRGVLALLDQPTFDLRSLPPLPAGLTGFPCCRSTWPRPTTRSSPLTKHANPQGADGFDQLEAAFRQRFGIDLRNDLLAGLGPKLSLYCPSAEADAAANPAMAMIGQFTGLTSRRRSAATRRRG